MGFVSAETLGGLVRAAAESVPDRVAIAFPDEQVTYRELAERVMGTGRAMIGMGVEPGQMVGVLMHNCLDQVALTFAAGAIGATVVPINNRNRGKELTHVVADGQLRTIFVGDLAVEHVDLPTRLIEALPGLATASDPAALELAEAPNLQRAFLLGRRKAPGMLDREAMDTYARTVDQKTWRARSKGVSAEMTAIMLYTSGTTAMPKGCPLLNRQLLDISAQIGERWGTRDGDQIWNALPLFHASGIIPMLASILNRGTYFTQHHFDATLALDIIRTKQITLAWPAFNTIWQEIITRPAFTRDSLDNVRAVLCVGPGETIRQMESVAPAVPLISCYGITEGIGVPVMARYDDDDWTRTETGGLPFDGVEVVVRDPDTKVELPRGERGLLWLRGRNVFTGYWRDPLRTTEVFDEDGWFNTGDLADIDELGRVRYLGRVKDMLKVGGENVAAVEIEGYLSTHPAVQIAAVVGAPDAKYGEVPAAFIELRAGHSATAEELIAFCSGQIASFKVPRYVKFMTSWPMSATKIRKGDLRDHLAAELGSAKNSVQDG